MKKGWIIAFVVLIVILGLVMVGQIFQKYDYQPRLPIDLQEEINYLFAQDKEAKVVLYPSRKVKLRKGSELYAFAFSIRNTNQETTTFNYILEFHESSCGIKPSSANDLIALRRTGSTTIESGKIMAHYVPLEFRIPEDFSSCLIGYNLIITDEEGNNYDSMPITVEIIASIKK